MIMINCAVNCCQLILCASSELSKNEYIHEWQLKVIIGKHITGSDLVEINKIISTKLKIIYSVQIIIIKITIIHNRYIKDKQV